MSDPFRMFVAIVTPTDWHNSLVASVQLISWIDNYYSMCCYSAVIELRQRHKETFLKKHGVKLGFMSPFVKAACFALQDQPIVNAGKCLHYLNIIASYVCVHMHVYHWVSGYDVKCPASVVKLVINYIDQSVIVTSATPITMWPWNFIPLNILTLPAATSLR